MTLVLIRKKFILLFWERAILDKTQSEIHKIKTKSFFKKDMNIVHYFLKFSLMIHMPNHLSIQIRVLNIEQLLIYMDFYINDPWQAVRCQGAHIDEKRTYRFALYSYVRA